MRTQQPARFLAFLPGTLLIGGTLLPVADFSPIGGGLLVLGARGDGLLLLLLGALLLLTPALRWRRPWTLLLAVITALLVTYDFLCFLQLQQTDHVLLGYAWPLLIPGAALALIAGLRRP